MNKLANLPGAALPLLSARKESRRAEPPPGPTRAVLQFLIAIVTVQAAEQLWADDGAMDTSWSLQVPISGGLNHVYVDPNGKILLSGGPAFASVAPSQSLIRLGADGAYDSSFISFLSSPVCLAFQADGKIVFGNAMVSNVNPFSFGRMDANGGREFGRQLCGSVTCVALQADGDILVGGTFDGPAPCDPNSPLPHQLARFKADGSLDSSFDVGLGPESFSSPTVVKTLALQPDGKILVGGSFDLFNGQSRNGIVRLNTNGSVDSSFTMDWAAQFENVNVNRLAVLADGRILIAGAFGGLLNGNGFNGGILRLNSDGTMDSSFVPSQQDSYVGVSVLDFVIQADGRILICGSFDHVGGSMRRYLARLNADGSLDSTFDAEIAGQGNVVSLALKDDGHLLVAGTFSGIGGFDVPHGTALASDGTPFWTGYFPSVARVLTAPAAVTISTPPFSQAAIVGSDVTLSVRATGTRPLSYQWRKNGTEIPGENGRTLTLAQVAFGDVGDYDVVVKNPTESVTSSTAALTLLNVLHLQSYSMLNGQHPCGCGFRDETYSGAGNPNGDLSPLSGGLGQLADGVLGGYSFDGPDSGIYDPWVGWDTVEPEITFDFGLRENFAQVAIHAEAYGPPAVLVFSSADISFGDDGVNFGAVTTYTTAAEERTDGTHLIRMPVTGSGRFVRVHLHNPVPGWFLMISEVSFGGVPDVSKVDSLISWSNPVDIVYGTFLADGQLNATASVPGAFTYVPPAGGVLSAGANQTLAVTFTPDDSAHYNTASATVTINVLRKSLTVTADSASRPYGTPNPSVAVFIAGPRFGDDFLANTSSPATPDSPPGSYPIIPSLVDIGGKLGNYDVTYVNGTLTVVPVNHPPVANADSYSALENTPLHVVAPGLLANDTEPDGDVLSVPEVRVPDHGSIFADLDGSFTYTPAPNYIGPDSFRYIISDSHGAKATNFAFITVMLPAVRAVQTIAGDPGDTVTVSTAPSVAGQAGVSATVENTGGAPIGLTVADYSSNPSAAAFSAGGGFTDVQIIGADSTMTATATFYYPSTIDPAKEAALTLFYYNGAVWVRVQSDQNTNPLKNTTDNLDGTISGGRFMVFFGSTSTPKITELNGTFFAVGILDTIPPSISCPNVAVPCGVDLLAPVSYPAPEVSDNMDPVPKVVYSVPNGSAFPVGTTVVSCTATDASGNSASTSFIVTRAALGFSGFLAPIGGADAKGGTAANPVGTFKMGSTIPVKFTTTCGGSPILIGAHKLRALKYSGSTIAGTPIDATPQDAATTGNEFRLTGGEWHFNLDTKGTGLSIGVWQLIATLSDGSQHSVWIQLK